MEIKTWSDLLQLVAVLLVGLLGVPLTQAVKNWLGWSEKAALALSAVVAFGVALLEVWLDGRVDFIGLTPADVPSLFGLVFTVATVYYKLFSGSESFFGKGLVLKTKEEPLGKG